MTRKTFHLRRQYPAYTIAQTAMLLLALTSLLGCPTQPKAPTCTPANCPSPSRCRDDQCIKGCADNQTLCNDTCINTNSSQEHCGSCGHSCSTKELCVNGTCQNVCPSNQVTCNETCVDLTSNPKHCGTCDISCRDDQQCTNGKCTCPDTTKECNGSCLKLDQNNEHCGRCGKICRPPLQCRQGSCILVCTDNQTICDNKCVDTMTNPQHCGACDSPCLDSATCQNGTCTCPEPLQYCNGSCINTNNRNEHCGACNKSCSANLQCLNGQCGCPAGTTECLNQCSDTNIDPAHCGSCGTSCLKGQVCVAGTCICPTGATLCGQECAQLEQSSNHCGTCGNACAKSERCFVGSCTNSCPTIHPSFKSPIKQEFTTFAFHPTKSQYAYGLGNSIVIQSLPNGKTIHTFAIPKGPVVKLMWEPGGNTILYQPDHKQTLTRIDATTGKQLPLSNAPTPTQLPHWELHPTLPYLAFFDPNKKTLTLFDYPSMTVRHTYTSQYHDIFAFHPTRAQIAIRTKKTEISVRDIISDKVLHTITDTQIDSLSINASDLLVYTYGKRYIVWDLAQKKQLHILQAAGLYLGGGYEAHHPKGTFMLLPGYYPLSVVKEWNLRTGKSIRTIRVGGDVFRKASYAPNGQHIGFTSRFYVTKSSQIEFYSCCPGDGTFCWSSGTCQILSNDAKHCGTCDNACSNGQTCNNGLCQ